MEATTIYTKNECHLGDCIYSMIMFKNINHYLEEHNITVYFYCDDENLPQVKDFNNSPRIIVDSLSKMNTSERIYDLWIGSSNYEYSYFPAIRDPGYTTYDEFFCKFYNNILTIMNIPVKLNTFIYSDEDLVSRRDKIVARTNDGYKDIDFLINNGTPRSGQYHYNVSEWNDFITKLSKKCKVVTTQKVDGVKCTREDNLMVADIAAISLNAKNIIAIESGVISGFYNKYITEDPNKKVYTLSNYAEHKCSFANFTWISELNQLNFLVASHPPLVRKMGIEFL